MMTSTRPISCPLLVLMLSGALSAVTAGCGRQEAAEQNAGTAPAGETVTRVTEHGPVRATVSLTPEAPRLGDPLTLTLEVEAEPGVRIEMPSFGEALGRFQIVQFVPRQAIRDGKSVAAQTYTLQAPMSGRQRIPPLRIEFVDERPGQAAEAAPQELLTEELPVQVASVLPEGAVAEELRPALAALPLPSTSRLYLIAGLFALVLAGAGGFFGLLAWRRRAHRQARISAYDAAMTRLHALEQRGLPGPEHADAWYVDLSAIVRRYLEDRYRLRAPELTTEEFLLEAQRSGQLTSAHRALLAQFLARCDRVKFARYAPEDAESQDALDSARAFLDETRPMDALPDTHSNARDDHAVTTP